ncbi:GHKL domain-containing protein [Metaclostridioides mangenotii]|uniref:GHKL domain-containing protein n=1 Tax=Metaclostridioides mangenotii TaxID=1540 RepID=UPI0028E52805|nr:GHKL domain-containing protein [Clostridioides mangenotii]
MLDSIVVWRFIDLSVVALELFVFRFIINEKNLIKTNNWYRHMTFTFIVILSIGMNIFEVLPNSRVVVELVLCLIYYKKNYRVGSIKCLVITLIFWLLVISLDSICMLLVLYVNSINDLNIVIKPGLYRLEVVIISKTLLIMVALFSRYFKLLIEISTKDFLYITIPIVTNIFSLLIVFGSRFNDLGSGIIQNFLLFLISILILVSNISLVFIISKIIKDNKSIAENELRNKRNNMEYDYYVRVEENNYKVRQLYHDMKNHLICIGNLCDSNDAKDYVISLNFELNKLDNNFNTGSRILDIILSEKKTVCIEKNINFTTYIDFSKGDFIDMSDISIIFGNSIDNAIQACDKINNDEINKKLDIKIKNVKNFIVIKIINTKVNEIRVKNNKIISDKQNNFLHGLGISNINEVVDKYSGELVIDYTDFEFILTILIPIQEFKK